MSLPGPGADDLAGAARRAAAVVSVPKAAPPDSFVLHAPLEIVARVGLVPLVRRDRRADAIAMIGLIADRYAAAGDPIEVPAGAAEPGVARLLGALRAGAVDEADRVAIALLPGMTPVDAGRLVREPVITALAAAGHAPIGFALLQRVEPAMPATLLHGALRAIAADPGQQVSWHRSAAPTSAPTAGDAGALGRAVAATPRLGRPAVDFVLPIMAQVQDAGVASELLAPVITDHYDPGAARDTLTRIAAWSMLYDDPAEAPYGWSHLLTMPQAVMAFTGPDPRTALAVAATFTVGFRAAYGTVDLPEVVGEIDATDATDASWEELATAAALHHDAHLVKHTLAAHHAAADDPACAGLYRAAAARLVEHWGA